MSDRIFLITGPSGFIGYHLFRKLNHSGTQLITCNRSYEFKMYNIENGQAAASFEDIRAYLANKEVIFVHCATKFDKTNSPKEVSGLFAANVLFPMRLLSDLLAKSEILFLNLNSYWQALEGEVGKSNSDYAKSKIAFSDYLKSIKLKNFKFTDVFLFDTYGPSDSRDKLIPYLLTAAKSNSSVVLSQSEHLLNFLYIDDVLEGILSIVEDQSREKIYELSSDSSYTIKEILKSVRETTQTRLSCSWVDRVPLVEMKVKWNIGPKPSGWRNKISFAEGLAKIWQLEK